MSAAEPYPRSVKIAVIGADGFIGRHLLKAARRQSSDALGTSRRRGGPMPFLDLAQPDIRSLDLSKSGHTHAVIAAARASIMFCETYPRAAEAVNVSGTLALVRQLAAEGVVPVFLSSDRVFDNAGSGPFDESAVPACNAVYGLQKLAVEQALAGMKTPSLVIRLSKVYGLERGDRTFFDDMAARLLNGRTVDPPCDQLFNPTWISDVVDGLVRLVTAETTGLVHLCAEPAASRRDLALLMARLLGADRSLVPEPLEPTVATPLTASRFRRLTGLTPLAPQTGAERVAAAYLSTIGH